MMVLIQIFSETFYNKLEDIFVLWSGGCKQEAALLPLCRVLALLHNLHLCLAHATSPVHVIHSICCKVETLDLGVTCFESTREMWGNRGSYFLQHKFIHNNM